MYRLNKSLIALCVPVVLAWIPGPAVAQEKPDILLVFMGNFVRDEPGINGGGIVRGTATPRLDQIANEGLRLTNFKVEVQCAPAGSLPT